MIKKTQYYHHNNHLIEPNISYLNERERIREKERVILIFLFSIFSRNGN